MTELETAARSALRRTVARAPALRVVVVGDVMLDRFLYGQVERISPEAPVPVVAVEREVERLGGAANVTHNLRSLGVSTALVGVVGDDPEGAHLREQLRALGVDAEGLATAPGRPTAVKTRVIARHQQVVRFDREFLEVLGEEHRLALQAGLERVVRGADAVIVSDYGKGVVGPALMEVLRGLENGAPVLVDPKPGNAACYRGAAVVTPNAREAAALAGLPVGSDAEAEAAGREIIARLGVGAVLVTRGEWGMSLVESGGAATHIPTRAKEVFDVTGAGDTTIAVFAVARAAGASLVEAACLANLAAGIVVGKLGTAAVTAEELADAAQGDRDRLPA